MRGLTTIFLLPILLLPIALASPNQALAQTSRNCADYQQGSLEIDCEEPVPVPYDRSFFGGIAGETTPSGIILGVINVLLAIVGLLSVLFVIIGGLRYITASGNEENAAAAKKTILHAVIGISVVILSFVLIRVVATTLVGCELSIFGFCI